MSSNMFIKYSNKYSQNTFDKEKTYINNNTLALLKSIKNLYLYRDVK